MSTLPTPHDDEQHHDVETQSKQFGKVSTAAMNLGYSHGALHCLLLLDTYWRDKDRVTGRPKDDAYPGQERLARELGVTRGTVQSYLNELAGLSVRGKPPKPAVIRKVRRGLGKTNVYVRLPQLRQHLRVVPPDAQPVVQPDAQPIAHPDAQPVVHKADEVEADEDKVKPTVGSARKKRVPSPPPHHHPISQETDEALVALVEALASSDAHTLRVFRRDFGELPAGAAWFALDKLEERRTLARERPGAYDVIHNEAGYARGILEAVANGYSRYDGWSAFFGNDGHGGQQ